MSVVQYLKVRSEESFFHRIVINTLPSCPDLSPNKGGCGAFCVRNNGSLSFILCRTSSSLECVSVTCESA